MKATMTLFVNSVVAAGAVDIAQVTSGWTEGGAHRLTRPAYLSPFLMGVPTTLSRQFVTVDVAQLVKDWMSGVGGNSGVQISATAAAPGNGDRNRQQGELPVTRRSSTWRSSWLVRSGLPHSQA